MKAARAFAAILVAGALVRLGTWTEVFAGGRIFVTQNDGWYHLRRAALTIADWPHVPRADAMINAPAGGAITWGVLFDWILATLALPWPHALELVGVLLPLVLGVIQLALVYVLVTELSNRRAALIATGIAALLPAIVHYTALGALDHDAFIQTCLLAALVSLVRRRPVLMAIALAAAFLAWAGSIVPLGFVVCALLASREREWFETTAIASIAAAVMIVPWVLTSCWPRDSFEGLSLLHIGALAGVAALSAAAAMFMGSRSQTIIATLMIALAVSLLLAPILIAPFIRGVKFAAGGASIQKDIAEGQPLFMYAGRVDFRPFLVWLTLLPLVALAACRSRFAIGWLVPTLIMAVLHTRFSYDAAIATCVAAAIALDALLPRFEARRVALLATIVLLTIIPAYVPLSGWERVRLFGHPALYHADGLDAVCDRLARRENGVVWAPWWFGHFILWRAQRPVVTSPFLTIGQSNFADAARFYFTRDPDEALRMLQRWHVRYVIVTASAPAIESLAAAARVDPKPLLGAGKSINANAYVGTVQGRLALIGGFGPFVEIDRSAKIVRGPAGPVPLIRVYEINPTTSRSSAPRS